MEYKPTDDDKTTSACFLEFIGMLQVPIISLSRNCVLKQWPKIEDIEEIVRNDDGVNSGEKVISYLDLESNGFRVGCSIFLEVIKRDLSNYKLCKVLPHFSLSSHLQELPKHLAKFIDATPTANDGCTKHIVPAFPEHFKLESELIKDQIRRGKTVGFNFVSIGNPEWIDHLYVGSTVMFKPPAYSDNSWTGFATYIVYETHDHDQFVKSGKSEEITFNFYTDKGLQHTIVVQNKKGSEVGQRGQFVIFPRKCFDGKLKEATFLDASVSTNRPDMVVKRCGIHIISKQDTAKFATDLIQTAGEYLLKESKVCPNCYHVLG